VISNPPSGMKKRSKSSGSMGIRGLGSMGCGGFEWAVTVGMKGTAVALRRLGFDREAGTLRRPNLGLGSISEENL